MLTRYRNLVITGSVGEPTRDEIAAIEHSLGAQLPEEFAEFLNVANGGYTEFSAKVLPTPEGESIACSSIYSTRRHQRGEYGGETFLVAIRWALRFSNMPRGVLPFARDPGGSEFCLDMTTEGRGRVVLFRREPRAWVDVQPDNASIQVADSFVEFVDSLHIDVEYAEVMLQDAMTTGDAVEVSAMQAILDGGLPDWREKLRWTPKRLDRSGSELAMP